MIEKGIYDEHALLLQVAAGDQQAFALLVDRYRQNIYTTALRLLHVSTLAEETLQDVFLKVWLQRTELPAIDNFPAWLHRVSKNTIYTAFKQSLRHQTSAVTTAEEYLTVENNTENRLLDKQYAALLQQAIDRLPARQKQTYLLIRQEGLKREEAARLLGVSPETIKFNLEEASRKVRAFCIAQLPLGALLLLIGRP
ncbi:MAG TPA: RNA polymerase sigma factor [Chitinophaga sp.]